MPSLNTYATFCPTRRADLWRHAAKLSVALPTVVGVTDDDLAERMRQLSNFVRPDSGAEDRAWRPDATSMEALVLKVIGGWEMLKSDVNWAYFDSAGPAGPKQQGLPATIRQVAKTCNVRWPHDEWSAACARAGQVRRKPPTCSTCTRSTTNHRRPTANWRSCGWAGRENAAWWTGGPAN